MIIDDYEPIKHMLHSYSTIEIDRRIFLECDYVTGKEMVFKRGNGLTGIHSSFYCKQINHLIYTY